MSNERHLFSVCTAAVVRCSFTVSERNFILNLCVSNVAAISNEGTQCALSLFVCLLGRLFICFRTYHCFVKYSRVIEQIQRNAHKNIY